MELQKLYYFVAAAQTHSFRKAAQICAVAQPVLSRQIAALEYELGVALFERSRTGVRLTPAGASFAEYARNALDQIQLGRQMLIELSSGVRGEVFVGCIEPLTEFFLARVFAPFHQRFPQVRLHMRIGGADDLMSQVEQHNLDFGLFGLALDQIQLMEQLHLHELFRDRVQLVAPVEHPIFQSTGHELAIEELVEFPYVMLHHGFSVRSAVEQAFARLGHHFVPVAEVDTLGSLLTCVHSGIGITFLPPSLLRVAQVRAGLATRPVENLFATFAFGVVYRRFEQTAPVATALIRAICREPLDSW